MIITEIRKCLDHTCEHVVNLNGCWTADREVWVSPIAGDKKMC